MTILRALRKRAWIGGWPRSLAFGNRGYTYDVRRRVARVPGMKSEFHQ
jgi:hypothetical protein